MTRIVVELVAGKDDDNIIKELNCALEQITSLRITMGRWISKHNYKVDKRE